MRERLRVRMAWAHPLAALCMILVGCGDSDPSADADGGIQFDAMPPTPDADIPLENCADTEALRERAVALEATFMELTAGVPTAPTDVELPEDTTGTLIFGLNPNALPLLAGDAGTRAAASTLGEGRVVAFSGQDFLSSQERSTLLDQESIRTLVRNAADWVSGATEPAEVRILADNETVGEVLSAGGFTDITVAELDTVGGLWETRDWSAEALMGYDVAVVQVNEWGTLHVDEAHVEALRAFVMAGGGLLISGSALHWSWWLNDSAERFQGDMILDGSGLGWQANSVRDLRSVRVEFDTFTVPEVMWCAYVSGESLDERAMGRLAPMFNGALAAGREGELRQALERMIRETPALPALAVDTATRLSADVASSLAPYDWPMVHPWTSTFPGLPTTEEVSGGTVMLDLSWSGARPLGYYAPPGRVVRIRVAETEATGEFRVQVGELYDDLRRVGRIDMWERAPHLRRRFAVDQAEISVVNAYGGALYFLVPPDMSGSVEIEVEGAIPMAVYTRGETEADAFTAALASGAPHAILQERGHIRMVVPTDEAARVEDPDAVTGFWSGFHARHADLAQEPRARRYESHWIFDPQVGYGYANATNARITYPTLAIGWVLRTRTGDEDWWLFGHELGHQFQTSNWRGGDVTEVCVNLFTMYTLNSYIFEGGNFETQGFRMMGIDHEALRASRWESADLFGKLQLYRQLIFEFGWERMREVFASYYSDDYPTSTYGEFMDGFAIRMSAIVERDLSGFFAHWEYPLSEEGAAQIQRFGHPAWMPPGW